MASASSGFHYTASKALRATIQDGLFFRYAFPLSARRLSHRACVCGVPQRWFVFPALARIMRVGVGAYVLGYLRPGFVVRTLYPEVGRASRAVYLFGHSASLAIASNRSTFRGYGFHVVPIVFRALAIWLFFGFVVR